MLGGVVESPDPRRRWPLVVAVVVFGGLLFLVAVRDIRAPTLDSSQAAAGVLESPSEPESDPTTGPPATARPLADSTGWRRLDLPGRQRDVVVGGSGWVSLSSAGPASLVFTSADGLRWEPHMLEVAGTAEVVSSTTEGIFVGVAGEGGFEILRSVDGGTSWTSTELPGAGVRWIGNAGTRIFATGASALVGDGPGMPAVWEFFDNRWLPVEIETSGLDGFVVRVVEWQSRPVAFGADPTATRWELDDGSSTPVVTGAGAYVVSDARVTDGRVWVLLSYRDNPVGSLRFSTDLQEWQATGDTGHRLAEVDGFAVLLRQSSYGPLTDPGMKVIPVDLVAPGDLQLLVGAASTGGTSVMAGLTDAGGALWVRREWGESDPGPVMAVSRPAVWATDRLQLLLVPDPQSTRFVPTGDGAYLVDGSHVVEIGGDGVVRVVTIPASDIHVDPFLLGEDLVVFSSDSMIRVSDRVRVEPVPDLAVYATGISGEVVIVGEGQVMWRRSDEGWVRSGVVRWPVVGVVSGGFLVMADGLGITTDGADLTPVEVAGTGGALFLVMDATGSETRVGLIDEWPVVVEVEVPLERPLEVLRVGGEIWARSLTEVVVSVDMGESWTAYPAGIETGLPPFSRFLPGDHVRLLGLDATGWQIYSLLDLGR